MLNVNSYTAPGTCFRISLVGSNHVCGGGEMSGENIFNRSLRSLSNPKWKNQTDLAVCCFPVSQAEVVFLQQVEVLTHLGEKLLTFSVFLTDKDQTDVRGVTQTQEHQPPPQMSLTSSSHSN